MIVLLPVKQITFDKVYINKDVKTNKDGFTFIFPELDEKNYIIRSADFYDLSLFKKNVSNVVYQINNIDNPMSDIHLLLYEEHYNNVNEPETFENFI